MWLYITGNYGYENYASMGPHHQRSNIEALQHSFTLFPTSKLQGEIDGPQGLLVSKTL